MTWAVTLDFHNTIAHCDTWFNLEVYDLIPVYLEHYASATGTPIAQETISTGRHYYRELRQRVMDTGIELDAVSAVVEVLEHLDLGADAADIDRTVKRIFLATLEDAYPLPGVVESVQQLHMSGVPLAVISSAAYHPFLEWTLEKFGIAGCFCEILTSASTGHYKSTTRIYETAVDTLGIEAARCIHVGDSERFDVRPAREIGMRTVLVGGEPQSKLADLQIDTLVDLPEILETRFGLHRAL